MSLAEQKERNQKARDGVMSLNRNYGVKWVFIASQIDMRYHSFVNWRKGFYMFGKERLDKVDKLLERYGIDV